MPKKKSEPRKSERQRSLEGLREAIRVVREDRERTRALISRLERLRKELDED